MRRVAHDGVRDGALVQTRRPEHDADALLEVFARHVDDRADVEHLVARRGLDGPGERRLELHERRRRRDVLLQHVLGDDVARRHRPWVGRRHRVVVEVDDDGAAVAAHDAAVAEHVVDGLHAGRE
eukprot:233722-Prymnesium_polylepis.1